jgi:hypothetical protein
MRYGIKPYLELLRIDMPRVSDLCKDFALRFGFEEAYVSGVARYLREAGLLTQGARGVNAPHALPLDAARLLIALMAGGKAKDAATVVRDFGPMVSIDLDEPHAFIPEGSKYEDTLARVIERFGTDMGDDWLASPHAATEIEFELIPYKTEGLVRLRDRYIGFIPSTEDLLRDGGMSDRYPIGFRVTATITNIELLSIGQVVAGHQPAGWRYQDEPVFQSNRADMIQRMIERVKAAQEQ